MSEDATATLLLHCAAEGDARCVRELLDADVYGSLPLYQALILAVEHGRTRVVRVLLDRGADANTVSDEGRTVLELAAANGHTKVVQCLMKHGADLSDADSDVWTPLVLAIENGHEETAQCLVERGADVNSTDYAGRPMLSVAVDVEQEHIVRFLVNNGAGVRMPDESTAATHMGLSSDVGQGRSEEGITRSDRGVSRWSASEDEGSGLTESPYRPASQGRGGDSNVSAKWGLTRWDMTVDAASCLGASAHGPMYRGQWRHSDVVVIVASDVDDVQRFKREVRRWFRINHPHVVQLFGACCDDSSSPVFVSEFASNGPLHGYLKAHPEQLWTKLYEVALGVQHLHDRGIVLGELTFSSVVIGSDLKAKVAGFGQRSPHTHGRERADTLAPEIVDDKNARTTLESDVFALGVLMVEAMRTVEADMLSEESFVLVKAGDDDDEGRESDGSLKGDACDAWVECKPEARRNCPALPERPVICTDVQWALVEKMCARDPQQRLDIGGVLGSLERLQLHRSRKLEQDQLVSLGSFNGGKLRKRWNDVQRLTLLGLQQRVFQDLQSIFSLLQQSVHPTRLLEQVAWLLDDFLRNDRFMRVRVLDPVALRSTTSMRDFGRRMGAVLRWLGHGKDQVASYAYRQIDLLLSHDLPTWLLLSEVVSDSDYAMLQALLKAELFGNAASYTFDQLVVIRSAYEEIDESTALGALDSLILRPRWFVRWGELQFEDRSGLVLARRATWRGTDVLVKRLERTAGGAAVTSAMERKVDEWFGLSHPNVVRLYGACHVGDRFLVCEDAPNGALNAYLRAHRGELWRTLLGAARGLAYLHARGVVHGHLGLSSVVVAADGTAKLTDVGVGATDCERSGDDWSWLASEDRTPESDVLALGMCITKALEVVSTPTEDGEREKARSGLEAFLADDTPRRPASCGDNEWELIQKMCARDPSERIQASAVVDVLEGRVGAEDAQAGAEAALAVEGLEGGRKRAWAGDNPPEAPEATERKRKVGPRSP